MKKFIFKTNKQTKKNYRLLINVITGKGFRLARETGTFSSKGIIYDFIGNLDRITVYGGSLSWPAIH